MNPIEAELRNYEDFNARADILEDLLEEPSNLYRQLAELSLQKVKILVRLDDLRTRFKTCK
jgi:hypothetical protein